MTATLLELDRVSKDFVVDRQKKLRAVRSVSLSLNAGETLGIVGESGCGKTTLARLVLRLEEPDAGTIRFDGTDITHLRERAMRPLRRHLQVVYQDPYSSLDPRMRVERILAEPLTNFGITGSEREARIDEALDVVGLTRDARRRYPHMFSGGQRQRIGIARALVLRPKLLICDEAVSALDVSIQAQILNLLRDIQERYDLALLFISHNLAVVRHLCHRIAVMYMGELVELADEHELFEHPLHPYTSGLLDAVLEPRFDREAREKSVPVRGEMPNPLSPPKGCAFRSRCPIEDEVCGENPELRAWRSAHWARCHFADRRYQDGSLTG